MPGDPNTRARVWGEQEWSVVSYGDGDGLVIYSGPDERVCFMATPGGSPGAMARIEAYARAIAALPKLIVALEADPK